MKDHVLRFQKERKERPVHKLESVNQFLARGGVIQHIPRGMSGLDQTLCMPQGEADKLRHSGVKGGESSRRKMDYEKRESKKNKPASLGERVKAAIEFSQSGL